MKPHRLRIGWVTFCVAIGVSGGLVAQPAHDKGWDLHPLNPPRVLYVFRAELKPESTLVRAELELDYRNLSQDTLPELLLVFPQAGGRRGVAGVIDSLLVNGVPVPGLRHDTSRVTHVTLLSPLLPKQSIHLLMAYQCRIRKYESGRGSAPVFGLFDWYPRVQPRENGMWVTGDSTTHRQFPGELSDYAVSLTIDSGWMAAGSGELLNEKELIGLLPRGNDTVLIDALAHPEREGSMTFAGLPAKNGKRTWLWRASRVSDFSAAVSKGWKFDRIISDSSIVDVFYNPNDRRGDRTKLDRGIQRLVRILDSLTGSHPITQTALVDGVAIDPRLKSELPILLSSGLVSENDRQVATSTKLSRLWTRPILPDKDGVRSCWSEGGLANYLAIEALHEIDWVQGYDKYFEYADRMLGTFDDFPPFSGGRGFRWMNRIREAHLLPREDTVQFENWFSVPTRLHLFRKYLGDSVFFAGLRRALSIDNTNYFKASELREFFEPSQKGLVWFFDAGWSTSDLDWSLTDVRSRATDSGVIVAGVCHRPSQTPLDLTLGLVLSSTDTVIQVISAGKFVGSSELSFAVLVPKLPRVVILDPHFDYPDAHRDNNYYFFERGAGLHEDLTRVFPGYRRLHPGR